MALYYSSLALCVLVLSVAASDNTKSQVFFDSVETVFLRQYRECTNDIKPVAKSTLAEWKAQMATLFKSPDYQNILKEYRLAVDSIREVSPCKVLMWNAERKKYQTRKEDTLVHDLLDREELETALREAKDLPTTQYDVQGLPFGLSKKSFLIIYNNKYSADLFDMGNYAYCKTMTWGKKTFLTAFYFDKKFNKYFKYEIEGVALTADLVNSTIRPQADSLANDLSSLFGPPSRSFSIGFFDIKSGILTPYKTWDTDNGTVYLGLSMNKYLYYVKVLVSFPQTIAK
jgi:hypothetical protein